MNIKRFVSIYSMTNDKILEEIDVSNIPLCVFREVLKIDNYDFNIYKVYKIEWNNIIELKKNIPQLSNLSFDEKVEIYLETYTWN